MLQIFCSVVRIAQRVLYDMRQLGLNFGSVALSLQGENGWMIPIQSQMMSAVVKKVLKRLHYPLEVILLCVRWDAPPG